MRYYRTSYHNHTTWSDGRASLAEMIDAARREGLEEFGISDHYALAPGEPRFQWALAPELLDDYVAQVQEAAIDTGDMTIRLGLEVDYFPETIGLIEKRLAAYSFDYIITSVHFVDGFAIDLNAQPWEELSQDRINGIWRDYWRHLSQAAETGLFDIIGHFDLPKKFRFYPSVDLTGEALKALDSVAAADMAIEINTAGWDRPVGEAYPSEFFLQEARRRKIPLIISADAHSANSVTRHFDRAHRLAADAGYTELVRFEKRKRFPYPLGTD
jgi:histidinol-phosphatase (PHP family)